MWLNAMVSTMSQEKMSRKARDKELQLGLKFSMVMKQNLSTTTAKTFKTEAGKKKNLENNLLKKKKKGKKPHQITDPKG